MAWSKRLEPLLRQAAASSTQPLVTSQWLEHQKPKSIPSPVDVSLEVYQQAGPPVLQDQQTGHQQGGSHSVCQHAADIGELWWILQQAKQKAISQGIQPMPRAVAEVVPVACLHRSDANQHSDQDE